MKRINSETNSDTCNTANTRSKAEHIKKQLSSKDSVPFTCVDSSRESPYTFDVLLKDFEEGCSALFDRGMIPVTRLLDQLGMDKAEIDESTYFVIEIIYIQKLIYFVFKLKLF